MDIRWFKNLKTKAQKEERTKVLRSYQTAFEELDKMLDSMRKPAANRNYSSPVWHNFLIASNEYNAALDDIKKLITMREKG